MSTNRPFFTNFFSAFRARTNPTFQAKSSITSLPISPTSLVSAAHVSTTPANVTTNPRTITTKAGPSGSEAAANNSSAPPGHTSTISAPTRATATANPLPFSANPSSHHHPHRYAPPLSRSPGTASPNGPYSSSSSTPGTLPTTIPTASAHAGGTSTPNPYPRGRQRRGSNSSNSSGGFIDALGPEKWYIGGRTAGGEETFYRLGLVSGGAGKRVRSLDRLSL